jgi:hypothetical protein
VVKRCKESKQFTAVDIACATSKCKIQLTDNPDHTTVIANGRTDSIHDVEICLTSLNNRLGFGNKGQTKVVFTTAGIISPQSKGGRPHSSPIKIFHLGTVGTEEIQTVVDFYDGGTQRVGNSFVGSKESHDVNYELDLC